MAGDRLPISLEAVDTIDLLCELERRRGLAAAPERCEFCGCDRIRHPSARPGRAFCTGPDGNGCPRRCAGFQEISDDGGGT